MCGIVGYTGDRDVKSVILVGLERLEYRGYDSCGIATVEQDKLFIKKVVGRLQKLKQVLDGVYLSSNIGIGHTRWATHGKVSENNAHPFTDCNKNTAVVHNGIIENYNELREELIKEGHKLVSITDSEIVPHLFERIKGNLLKKSLYILKQLEGSYALGVIDKQFPNTILGIRQGSPLVAGIGDRNDYIIASDPYALIGIAKRIYPLEDGEIVIAEKDKGIKIYTRNGKEKETSFVPLDREFEKVSKGRYAHFMRKEIMEQPDIIEKQIQRFFKKHILLGPEFRCRRDFLKQIDRIIIEACGTSYHASLVGRYYLEKFAHIHTDVEIASEFIDRITSFKDYPLMIAVSQSGETADTLEALRLAKKELNISVLSVVNNIKTSIERESNSTIYTGAGVEVGVAATKTYTSQLMSLLAFSLLMAELKGYSIKRVKNAIQDLPFLMRAVLKEDKHIKRLSTRYQYAQNFLFLGRGLNLASALEGALKLKEISYIYASAYPAGELKHGPISLIDKDTPVIVIAPEDSNYKKMISNVEEIVSRGARVIGIGTKGDKHLKSLSKDFIALPDVDEFLLPFIVAIPLQLFAYHVATLKGCDVDKPRNLAKSVTVL